MKLKQQLNRQWQLDVLQHHYRYQKQLIVTVQYQFFKQSKRIQRGNIISSLLKVVVSKKIKRVPMKLYHKNFHKNHRTKIKLKTKTTMKLTKKILKRIFKIK